MAVEHIPFTAARAQLADLVGRVGYGHERVVLTRHGRPIAALVPMADLERLEADSDADGAGGGEQVVRLSRGAFGQPGTAGADLGGHLDAVARSDPGLRPH